MHSSTRPSFLPFFSIFILSFAPLSRSRVYPNTLLQTQMKSGYGSDSDVEIFYFDQNLDHFSYKPESYTKFRQRYAIDFRYWDGAKTNSPILAYLGAESPMDVELRTVGFLRDNGPHFKALLVHIEKTSATCHEMIRKSWDEIDRVASPFYSVDAICNAIDSTSPKGTEDLLSRIFAGVVAHFGKKSCYDITAFSQPTSSALAWSWQICSELVMPIGRDQQDTLFQTKPFNMSNYISECENTYRISPRPHWINIYYGGEGFKSSLRKFGGNIIFSNGLSDPYRVGGVLEDISDTILAVKTNGSHCMDLVLEREGDPTWLVLQRQKEVEIIDSWISIYQKDLKLEA